MIGRLMSHYRYINFLTEPILLQKEVHDKIRILGRSILSRHNSKINTFTLKTNYFTIISLK